MSPSLQAELDHALTAAVDEMRLAVGQLMVRLEQLDSERVQLSQGAPEASRTLAPRWQEILQSLRACQQLNQRNGYLVGLRLQQVRKALAVLTGNEAEASVYGRAGDLRTSLRSQSLAEA